jgi:uncharacterized protein YecT (DUF1311 family)
MPRSIVLIAVSAAFCSLLSFAPAHATESAGGMAAACRAAGNDDTVRDYQPALHEGAVRAFRKLFPEARDAPSDDMLASEAKFRCMDGTVYACFIGANLPCSKISTDTRNPGADAFCKDNPDADSVPMAATGHDTLYSYRCRKGRAETAGKLFDLDRRGFAKSLWAPIDAETAPAEPAETGKSRDPIEAAFDKCLATPDGQTTIGMAECSHRAYLAYDKEMNALYRRVLRAVDAESAKRIRAAQRRWLAYRKAEESADNGPWRKDRGSMAAPDIEALNVDAIRNRIAELRYYAP